jgi:deoxycytidylate deaminase
MGRTESELIFAFVAPVGTDAETVATNLDSQLREFGFSSEVTKISSQIPAYCKLFGVEMEELDTADEAARIRANMGAGNALNAKCSDLLDSVELVSNSVLALAAVLAINGSRVALTPSDAESVSSFEKKAHILLTLKRPGEINLLRKIYGAGLYVIALFATEEERLAYLQNRKHLSEGDATDLVRKDEDDKAPGGQRTRDAFHLADLFLHVGNGMQQERIWKGELGRFLDLIFSHPYHTPSIEEEAMFFAHAAALRSAQLGRQVGAAIVNQRGELLAVGCNEVPKAGGGQYRFEDRDDCRDHILGRDSNDKRKREILEEILEVLPDEEAEDPEFRKKLEGTSIFSITEFGRAMHAEMEAILSCARKGISPVGATLYTTTFPCHNCARHVIGSGIMRVVYVEPYPKSQAVKLHGDAIQAPQPDGEDCSKKVIFEPFVGISPRRYAELFTTRSSFQGVEIERKKNGLVFPWRRLKSQLRSPLHAASYIGREAYSVADFRKIFPPTS